jgi:acyl-homoserine-lactone acylase
MLLSAPSGPWTGPLRLWEVHLTVPGRFDVYGATPVGVPGVVLGFSDDVAWTIAPSAATRLTAYALTFEPGQPTMYRFDDGVRPLESEEVTIEVRDRDGSMRTEQRTLWRSHHGPLLAPTGRPWTAAGALAVRGLDVDIDVIGFSLALAKAGGLDELRLAAAVGGPSPWGATVVAGPDGRVLYLDTSAVPALDATAAAGATTEAPESADSPAVAGPGDLPPLVSGVAGAGDGPALTVLDGSTSQTEWIVNDVSGVAGRVPFEQAPQLERTDHLVATSSGHWLVNPAAPLEGFDPMFGAERTSPDPGDRQALVAMADLVSRDPGEAPVTLHEVRDTVFDNRSITGALLRDAVVERCRAAGPVFVTAGRGRDGERLWAGHELDLDPACDALGRWDASFELESRGAVLWREFSASFVAENLTGDGDLFKVPFDPSDPLGTPRGLAPPPMDRPDPVVAALAQAVALLEQSGVAVDAPIREVQYTDRADERIPVHGGFATDGTVQRMSTDGGHGSSLEPQQEDVPALLDHSRMTFDGYPVRSGTSFVLAVAFEPDGPVAEALLPYGQSGDPTSPFAADQTYRFSDEAWRPVRFTDADLSSDPNRTTQELRAPRTGG